MIDQAISSVITFVLIAALSRTGGPTLVGSVAILQTVALTGLAAARAIGIDVWAAGGSPRHERASAIGPALCIASGVLAVNMFPWLLLGGVGSPLTLYWLATPLIVLVDAVRILLLHDDRTWISVVTQGLTMTALLMCLLMSSPSADLVLALYLVGTIGVVIAGLFGMKLAPPLPTLGYSFKHRSRSGPFLLEISLGSIMQQVLFMLMALLSSVEAAGQIRIAQTLLGPMSVIHAGLAPQLLRRLARITPTNRRRIANRGRKFGLALAAFSLIGAISLGIVLPLEFAGRSLLGIIAGARDLSIPPILMMCGVALSSGAVILGTGTAARILGLTPVLNKWRLLLVVPQVATVCLAASTGNAFFAAGGLAISALLTAAASILIISKNVGRKGRRAKPS